jgi:hypothetical protein
MSELSDRDWNRHKWAWVEALVQDQPSRGLAHDIAVLLARRYLQADKGRYAWVGLKTLAKELGVGRTSVIRGLDKLIADGWLVCEAGGKGRGDSNHYFLPECIPVPIKGSADGTLNEPNKGSADARKGYRPRTKRVPPTHEKGTAHGTQVESRASQGGREERGTPLRGDSRSAPLRSALGFATATRRQGNATERVVQFRPRPAGTKQQHGQSTARPEASPRQAKPNRNARPGKLGGSSFPDGWVLGDAELAIAVDVCGWELPTAEHHFRRFRLWHLQNDARRADWSAAWEKWCVDELDKQERKPRTQMEDVWEAAKQAAEEEEQKRRERKH